MEEATTIKTADWDGWRVDTLLPSGPDGMLAWIERLDPETAFDVRAERLRVRMMATVEELATTGQIEGMTEQIVLVPNETADFIMEQAIRSGLTQGEFVAMVMRLYRDTPQFL